MRILACIIPICIFVEFLWTAWVVESTGAVINLEIHPCNIVHNQMVNGQMYIRTTWISSFKQRDWYLTRWRKSIKCEQPSHQVWSCVCKFQISMAPQSVLLQYWKKKEDNRDLTIFYENVVICSHVMVSLVHNIILW